MSSRGQDAADTLAWISSRSGQYDLWSAAAPAPVNLTAEETTTAAQADWQPRRDVCPLDTEDLAFSCP